MRTPLTFLAIVLISNLTISSHNCAMAQLNFDFQEGTFLIKGKVLDIQTKNPVPKANITTTNRKGGVTADIEGVFSMYVFPTDTLRCSSLGYISKIFAVSEIHPDSIYKISLELIRDFVKLKEVNIYPYRNMEEFKQAFLEAKEVNNILLPGIAPPKYTTNIPRPKFTNPISLIYERARKKRAANPDFKPD